MEYAVVTRPSFTAELIQELRLRVISHNEAHPSAPAKLAELKKIYIRGYRRSHPGERAMAAVDAYLRELADRAKTDASGQVSPSIGVPLSSPPVYEAGAVLFSYLGFPDPDEDIERGEAQVALCGLALHAMAQEDPASMWIPQLIKPGHLMFPKRNVDRIMRTFDRRLRDRLVAAVMAAPLLKEAETDRSLGTPPGMNRLSIAQLADSAREVSGQESPVNVQSRVWAPSLPVIHLAVATAVAISHAQKAGAEKLDVQVLCRSPDFVRFVVDKAQKYESLLLLAPKLHLALERLIRFRLT